MDNMNKDYIQIKDIDVSVLEKGAKDFEIFWLRPKKMHNKEAIIRMKINKKWGGWKLKDELVQSLGLTIGDTINTEVSVLNAPGLIRSSDDTDLFADGTGADWLLDNNVGLGAIIDAKVRFTYTKAPVGGIESREVWKVSLVFLEGYSVIQERDVKECDVKTADSSPLAELMKFLGD